MTAKNYLQAEYPETVTREMIEEAVLIGEIVTGTHDWQGMKATTGTPGLVCLVQEFLDSDRELRICNFLAYEEDGEYRAAWK